MGLFTIACYEVYFNIVKYMIDDERINLNQVNNTGDTSFALACQHCHLEIIQYMIKNERIDFDKLSNDKNIYFVIQVIQK